MSFQEEYEKECRLIEDYINKNEYNKSSSDVVYSVLKKMGEYETLIQKTLLDWSYEDIEGYLNYINSKNVLSLSSKFSTVRGFADFLRDYYIEEGSLDPNVLPIFMIDVKLFDRRHIDFADFINKQKSEESILKKNEYFEIIEDPEMNIYTKAILILIWHRVTKKIDDIFSYKRTEIDFENKIIKDFLGKKERLKDIEIEVLEKIEEYQSLKHYGVEYAAITCDDGRSFYVDTDGDGLVFHHPLAYDRRTNGEYNMIMRFTSKKPFEMKHPIIVSMWSTMVTKIGKQSMTAKNVYISSCYEMMINQFNITKDNIDSFKTTNLIDYLSDYCVYQKRKLKLFL